jgi:hypothetical protein
VITVIQIIVFGMGAFLLGYLIGVTNIMAAAQILKDDDQSDMKAADYWKPKDWTPDDGGE